MRTDVEAEGGRLDNHPAQNRIAMEGVPTAANVPCPSNNSEEGMRIRVSTVLALTMAILGSSVLPVSYAFASTGISAALTISLLVATCNTYTCQLLLRAADTTKTSTFEELASAIGGKPFMRFAQVSNIILLFGNLTGDFCLLADLGSQSLKASLGDKVPKHLVNNHGRGIMLVLIVCVIFPLSLFRGMRALEYVSSAGMLVLAALFSVLTYDAVSSGFNGITSGEVPLWSFGASTSNVAEAFALIGFSFYLHPLMMPMLQEMPFGHSGVQIMSDSVTIVIMGVAFVTYSIIGVMGSAAFGADTNGDVMMNQVLTGPVASAAFTISMLIYLSSCIPPLVLSLRCYLDFIIAGPRAFFRWHRHLVLTVGIILLPICLAWNNPSLSKQAFALTGASGVCIVCYFIPIVAHFKLLFLGKRVDEVEEANDEGRTADDVVQPLLVDGGIGNCGSNVYGAVDSAAWPGVARRPYTPRPKTLWQWVRYVVWPILVLVIGCGLSALALYVNFF